jgi:biotin synthase
MNQPLLTTQEIKNLYEMPLFDALDHARRVHMASFQANKIETCRLLSIKTGRCPEDCRYCAQSAHYKTDINVESLLDISVVIAKAKQAKAEGITRFCMAGAWKGLPKKSFDQVIEMIRAVSGLGLETCLSAGGLTAEQANTLKAAGLDYYNHNLDTSPEYYSKMVTTRRYQDRLDTLQVVADAKINTCCGGIISMGESREDRIGLLYQLATLSPQPKTVPINAFIPVEGTPFANQTPFDECEFIRTIVAARIVLPYSVIRLSAGRDSMSDALQALCFFAGANSIFTGEKLLTQSNPTLNDDAVLFGKLGLEVVKHAEDLQRMPTQAESV